MENPSIRRRKLLSRSLILLISVLPLTSALAATLPKNQKPIANAGPDQLAGLAQSVNLNGSQSYDPDQDGSVIAYQWKKVKGPKVKILDPKSPTTSFTTPATLKKNKPVDLVFKLTVTDNRKGKGKDTVIIHLSAQPCTPPEILSNGACVRLGCSLPWGGTLQHGVTSTAYQSATAALGNSCISELRSCTDGVLSGSYQYQSCSAQVDSDGDGMPDDWETAHGLDPMVNDAGDDKDGDFVSNLKEYQDGTDPADKNSFLPGSVSCTPPLLLQNDTCVTPPSTLNDTGITTCSDDLNNGLACPVAGFPGQDAQSGRDVTHNDNSDGHAGFSFTKLDSNGNALPASASAWDCVKDNVTGLIWEVKTTSGLRSMDNTYTWYEPDTAKNGGLEGYQNGGICTGSNCDTYSFVQAVNAQGLCGANNWRMPTVDELSGIAALDRINPAIDSVYFPNTPSNWFWSSSPVAYYGYGAWGVDFVIGYDDWYVKYYQGQVRLVRSGQ